MNDTSTQRLFGRRALLVLLTGCIVALLVISVGFYMKKPNETDVADEIVKVLNYSAYYEGVSSAAIEEALNRVNDRRELSEAERADFSDKMKSQVREFKPIFMKRIAEAYRAQFTAAELNTILEFYSSSAGRKVGEKQKLIQDSVGAATRNLGVIIGTKVAELFR